MQTPGSPLIYRILAALLVIVLAGFILYIGRDVLMPIAFSAFIAVLLDPVVKFLTRHRVSRLAAICIAVLAFLLVVAGVLAFCAAEIAQFTEELPKLEERVGTYLHTLQQYVEEKFNIQPSKQTDLLKQGGAAVAKGSGAFLGGTLLALGNVTLLVFLIPIYVFLFLFYRDLFTEFFFRLANRGQHGKVGAILHESSAMVQQYLVGRLIETVLVTVLNTAALFALGIDYAILFGLLAGLLNLIPFIGVFIGSILPTIMALITKDSVWYAVGVVGTFSVIQFIDNHLIMPFIVGGRVKINSLVAIAALIVGGELWGVVGMVLSLPIVAIIKVVFDRINGMKPWGMLLGDDLPAKG